MEDLLQKVELQKKIIECRPKRSELLEYKPQSHQRYRGSVYRNHSFELIEHSITAYLDYAGFQVDFSYSDYDDSLSFLNLDRDSDFLIIWLDTDRYKNDNFQIFFSERMEYLSSIYKKPVLVVLCGEKHVNVDSKFLQFNMQELQMELKTAFFDERLEKYSGTRLSAKACLLIAEQLGLRYIPALLKPALKALVVDLDNTLYKGVLGEDGIWGVELTEGHKQLQEKLLGLSQNGFLLCIASKNEIEDVRALFKSRTDFPLKWEDFAVAHISWAEKVDSIDAICKTLNIGVDSILFVDDNYGELVKVHRAYPEIKEVLAADDANITAHVLALHPGLMKTVIGYEDIIRKGDLQANIERKKLQSEHPLNDYMRALQIKLTYHINDENELHRVSELANKTNQFIFSYKRYKENELRGMISSSKYAICTVALEDKLSDSGIIAVCVMKKEENVGYLEECFVSCRALGRGLDEIIVLGAIDFCLKVLDVKLLKVEFTNGERNKPAKDFYESYLMNIKHQFEYKKPEGLAEYIMKNYY